MERKEIDTDKDTKMNKHRHTQKHLHADKKKDKLNKYKENARPKIK